MNLFILRQSPYSSQLAREALDMALAFAAFDQEVAILFMGDGVYQLLEQQSTLQHGVRNIGKSLDSLALFDIEKVFICAKSLKQRQLQDTALKPLGKKLQPREIGHLISDSHKVFNF